MSLLLEHVKFIQKHINKKISLESEKNLLRLCII